MADLKIYESEVIQDAPLPNQGEVDGNISQQTSGSVYGSETIQDQPLPVKKYAQELLSKTLNTVSQKILGAYTFTQHGAIQIGKYLAGQSGEIKISPDGIVAKNKNGDTTFALDGDTGDATFKGTLKAGTLIAGDDNVIIEQAGNNGGRIILFSNGLPSIVIGEVD